MYEYMYVYMYHVYMYVFIYVCVYVSLYMYVCVCVCMYVCMYVYVCRYICMYVAVFLSRSLNGPLLYNRKQIVLNVSPLMYYLCILPRWTMQSVQNDSGSKGLILVAGDEIWWCSFFHQHIPIKQTEYNNRRNVTGGNVCVKGAAFLITATIPYINFSLTIRARTRAHTHNHTHTYTHTYTHTHTHTHIYISRSSQCSTTGVTKAVVCAILSVGWCI